MKRAVKAFLIVSALAFVAIVLAVPFAVPPIASRIAEDKLAEYGLVSDIRLRLGYCWRNGPGVEGALNVALIGTPWRVSAEFGASCCEWSAHVSIPETHFSERDPLLQRLLAQKELPGVSEEAVRRRSLLKFEERIPAGSGVWIQDASGKWRQK